MRLLALASAFSMLATASNAGVVLLQAAPSSLPIVHVADGCGPGFHLGPRGFCRPNGPRVVVVEPRPVVVARPVVVERPIVVARPVIVERPVVVARPACGLRIGPIAVRGAC